MNITWYGHSCFKIQTKPQRGSQFEEITIITDPFDKSVGLRPPQGQANIVTVSHTHPDHSNVDAIKGNPFVVDSPGEYSIEGITIEGIDSFHDNEQGAQKGRNTIFLIESEDLKICHLGDLGHKLTEDQLDKLGEVDVLMIPVGGHHTLDSKAAEEVIGQIEPKMIIPMHYNINGNSPKLENVDKFCKEFGSCEEKDVQKLNIKKKDLEEVENRVVVMAVANS